MPRPALPKDLRLIYKVSRLYYEDNCTEDEIAARFSISRSKVSRLLKQAREAGIVTISVISPPGFYPRLEEDLEKRFYLRDAVVVGYQIQTQLWRWPMNLAQSPHVILSRPSVIRILSESPGAGLSMR